MRRYTLTILNYADTSDSNSSNLERLRDLCAPIQVSGKNVYLIPGIVKIRTIENPDALFEFEPYKELKNDITNLEMLEFIVKRYFKKHKEIKFPVAPKPPVKEEFLRLISEINSSDIAVIFDPEDHTYGIELPVFHNVKDINNAMGVQMQKDVLSSAIVCITPQFLTIQPKERHLEPPDIVEQENQEMASSPPSLPAMEPKTTIPQHAPPPETNVQAKSPNIGESGSERHVKELKIDLGRTSISWTNNGEGFQYDVEISNVLGARYRKNFSRINRITVAELGIHDSRMYVITVTETHGDDLTVSQARFNLIENGTQIDPRCSNKSN
ncbi:MAG: hypothetical protein H6608_05935 [Flavobacteriales bacterium]|nr:hypothetical protein [Flavobacteriales bacterium]